MDHNPGGDEGQFRRELRKLKRRGSTLLVVGKPDLQTRRFACERLLGESSESRYHVFVVTTSTPDAARQIARRDTARVLVHPMVDDDVERPASGPGFRSSVPIQRLDASDLDDLARAIGEAIDTFDADGDGLAPGELRLCVDSLLPLVATYPAPSVDQFLATVGDHVTSARGMAHYHFPVPTDDDRIPDLREQFDAVIRLRSEDGRPEQRVVVQESNLDSGWIPL